MNLFLPLLSQLVENMKNTCCLSKLTAGGGDPNLTDRFGRAPLHLAAVSGDIEAAIVLLKGGAMINARDKVAINLMVPSCHAIKIIILYYYAIRMASLRSTWHLSTLTVSLSPT